MNELSSNDWIASPKLAGNVGSSLAAYTSPSKTGGGSIFLAMPSSPYASAAA